MRFRDRRGSGRLRRDRNLGRLAEEEDGGLRRAVEGALLLSLLRRAVDAADGVGVVLLSLASGAEGVRSAGAVDAGVGAAGAAVEDRGVVDEALGSDGDGGDDDDDDERRFCIPGGEADGISEATRDRERARARERRRRAVSTAIWRQR